MLVNNTELEEILVNVNRCTKVTKGGRTFSFSAIVVVGNKKGRVGFGLGKALEIMDAKLKAIKQARANMLEIALKENRTVFHDVVGKFSSSLVKIRTAPAGKGVIAGGAIRSVFKALGIQDIVVKSLGSNNAHNVVKATINGLLKVQSPKMVFKRRGVTIIENKQYLIDKK